MARTQDELVAAVLGQLGAMQNGETPSTEDAALVVSVLQGKIDELALRGVTYVADTTDIPDVQFYWLSVALANDPVLADQFAKPVDAGKIQLAERRLRQINGTPDSFPTLEIQSF